MKTTEIITEKITKNLWLAKVKILSPFKATIEMQGETEENAKTKLELCLANKPYKHLK